MPKGTSILQVRATDADEEENENSRISYSLSSADFTVDPKTGVISTAHDGPIVCSGGGGGAAASSNSVASNSVASSSTTSSASSSSASSANECWLVITVFAQDHGSPRQDGRTYVTAKILDSNNHAPSIKFRYFSKSQWANVDEGVPSGSVVAAVSVVDFDHGRNGQTTVALTGGNELGHFRLDSVGSSHILKVNGSLDREVVPRYNLSVTATDQGSPRKSTTAQLLIYVQDTNDHTPAFEREVYEAVVSETRHQVGLFVAALRATDLDEGINAQLYYSLSGANAHYFRVDATSGLVTTEKVINREEIDAFDLKVTATDGGSNPKWAQASLKVKVLDVNDEVPQLQITSSSSSSSTRSISQISDGGGQSSYELEVHEGQYLDLELVVKDADLGNNGTVDVSLLFDYERLFRLEETSSSSSPADQTTILKLLSTEQLIGEQCDAYELVLLARDRAPAGAELSSLTTIHLFVVRQTGGENSENEEENENENEDDGGSDDDATQPAFYPRQYFARIAADSVANFSTASSSLPIIQLKVNDGHEFDDEENSRAVTFTVRRSSSSSSSSTEDHFAELFDVSEQGQLRLKRKQKTEDSEKQLRQQLGASSRRQPKLLTLTVDCLQCRAESSTAQVNVFIGGSGSGSTNSRTTDYEKDEQEQQQQQPIRYHFTVPANSVRRRRSGSPTTTTTTVGVLDRLPDSFTELQLVSGDLHGHFRLLDNRLVLEKPLKRLKQQQKNQQTAITTFQLGAVALKSGGFQRIEITVDVVNTDHRNRNYYHHQLSLPPAHFSAPFEHISVPEDAPAMYVLRRFGGEISASSGGSNESLSTVEFTLLENPQDLFLMEGSELRLARAISGPVMARWASSSSSSSKKPISAILRVKIRASDKRTTRQQSTSAAEGATSRRCQCSNELTLFISINSSQSENSRTAATASSARFSRSFFEFALSEATPINEQVFRLPTRRHLTLADDSSAVSAAIVGGNVNNSFGVLPSGLLYVRRPLDREATELYLLEVVLHDSRLSSSSRGNTSFLASRALDRCQVLIRVTDVNDQPPVFDRPAGYHFAVPEGVPKNFLIGRVGATDRDVEANARVVYSVVPSYYSAFVTIHPETGYLWSSVEYDREALASFEITVQATDQPVEAAAAAFSTAVPVRVDILDRNDNRPVFEVPANVTLTSSGGAHAEEDQPLKGKLVVSEATAVGAVVACFRAVDIDQESAITYLLEEEEEDSAALHTFALDRTGTLTLRRPLDREQKDFYQVTVQASDGLHRSRFELSIQVEDVNDSLPTWVNLTSTSTTTELTVPENISIGSEIMQLHAEDRDLGVNGLFHFAIEQSSSSSSSAASSTQQQQKVFDILDSSRLVVVNHLDFEKSRQHLLNISLIESQSGRVASSRLIRVNIENVNDCLPVFGQRQRTADTEVVRVQENGDIGSKLLTLAATDCDQGDTLTYEIVRCNTHYHTHNIHDSNNCPLSLNARNGEIININNLDREVIESINLQVSVRDTAGHADKMKVVFIIEDENDEKVSCVCFKVCYFLALLYAQHGYPHVYVLCSLFIANVHLAAKDPRLEGDHQPRGRPAGQREGD